jgi:hypothetical protein
MARLFTAASSHRIDLNTTLGNWEGTQPWSLVTWVRMSSNASGQIFSKQDATANVRGWSVLAFVGATNPTVQVTIQDSTTLHIVQRTSAEVLVLNTYEHLVVTYDGTGLAAGITFYIGGSVSSKAAPVADTLGGNTILNSVASQIACKGGTGSPNTFLDGRLRRTLLYNVALSQANVTALFNDTVTPYSISGLQAWYEFGSKDDGHGFEWEW